MNIKRENARHERVINQINEATSLNELPSVSYNDIANLLASKEYNGKRIIKDCFDDVIEAIKEYGLKSEKVIYYLTQLMINSCDISNLDFDAEEIKASTLYKEIINEGKIEHLYEEIKLLEEKKKQLLQQKEDIIHREVLEQIKYAKTIEKLPNVKFSDISKYLASKEYFGTRISQSAFKSYIKDLMKYGNPMHEKVVESFKNIIIWHTTGYKSFDEIIKIYNEIINDGYLTNLLYEVGAKKSKEYEIQSDNDYKLHMVNMCVINNSFEEKDFPKIGIGELNRLILKAVNSNSFGIKVKTADINEIAKVYLTKGTKQELDNAVSSLVDKMIIESKLNNFDFPLLRNEILGSIINDLNIDYRAEEIIRIEQRRREIYESDHNDLMDILKEATRMYQLPSISFSTLTSYLCGNSTIYPNESIFKSEHFKKITEFLLSGKKWEDKEVIDELKRICSLLYPNKSEEAFRLLFKKLTSLPKTYYLVEEINLVKNLQKEFIKNGQSNVNVYFVENPKAPSEGGKFYNVYINRVNKLNLYEILPLDLNSIVAPGTDIDAVEWLVAQKDKTFKKVGGIILYRDETIGDITVYRVNDGKVHITEEDKEILDDIKDLQSERDKLIEENNRLKEENQRLKEEYEKRVNDRFFINKSVGDLTLSYKMKLLSLQGEIKESISFLDEISGFVKKIEGPKE